MGTALERSEGGDRPAPQDRQLPHSVGDRRRHGRGGGRGGGASVGACDPRRRRAAVPGVPDLPVPRPFDVRRPALPLQGRGRGVEAQGPGDAVPRLGWRRSAYSMATTWKRSRRGSPRRSRTPSPLPRPAHGSRSRTWPASSSPNRGRPRHDRRRCRRDRLADRRRGRGDHLPRRDQGRALRRPGGRPAGRPDGRGCSVATAAAMPCPRDCGTGSGRTGSSTTPVERERLHRRRHRRGDRRDAADRRDHDGQLLAAGARPDRQQRGDPAPHVRRPGRRAGGDPHGHRRRPAARRPAQPQPGGLVRPCAGA